MHAVMRKWHIGALSFLLRVPKMHQFSNKIIYRLPNMYHLRQPTIIFRHIISQSQTRYFSFQLVLKHVKQRLVRWLEHTGFAQDWH